MHMCTYSQTLKMLGKKRLTLSRNINNSIPYIKLSYSADSWMAENFKQMNQYIDPLTKIEQSHYTEIYKQVKGWNSAASSFADNFNFIMTINFINKYRM